MSFLGTNHIADITSHHIIHVTSFTSHRFDRVDEQRRISTSGSGSGGKNSSSGGNSSSGSGNSGKNSSNIKGNSSGGAGVVAKDMETSDRQSTDKKRKYHDDDGNHSGSRAVGGSDVRSSSSGGCSGSGSGSGGLGNSHSNSSANELLTNYQQPLEMKGDDMIAAEAKKKKSRQQPPPQQQQQQQHGRSRGGMTAVIVPVPLTVQPSAPEPGLATTSGPGLAPSQHLPQASRVAITIPRPPPITSYASRSKPHLRRITPTYIMPLGNIIDNNNNTALLPTTHALKATMTTKIEHYH